MLESTIHWREGLGWHGLTCLLGPVHRDAIPILAALSLVAVAVHGAVEHLLDWARRLFAQLGVAIVRPAGRAPRPLRPVSTSRGRALLAERRARPARSRSPSLASLPERSRPNVNVIPQAGGACR